MLAPQAVARAISPSQVERSVSRLMMYFNIVNIISRAGSRKNPEINGKNRDASLQCRPQFVTVARC